MGWKSKKDGTHFNNDKKKRDVGGHYEITETEVKSNFEPMYDDQDKFAEGVKKDFENKIVKLENKASVGIRAYTDEVFYDGIPLVLGIGTHHPYGKYIIEPFWKNQNGDHYEKTKLNTELAKARFNTFDEAKSFIERKFNITIQLDSDNSNDYQTWEENIKQTDHILPYDKEFWSLPDKERWDIRPSESTEDFLRRIKQ